MAKPTRLDYCQYLLRSPLNYTLTHFADHSDRFTHDMLNRYLGGIASRRVNLGKTSTLLTSTAKGVILFDDTVQDKRYAQKDGPRASAIQWQCERGSSRVSVW